MLKTKNLFLIVFIFSFVLIKAQTKPCYSGILKDSFSNRVISNANIQIYQTKNPNVILGFTSSDSNGYFNICSNVNDIVIEVIKLGYKDIKINPKTSLMGNNDLGLILMNEKVQTLKGFGVKAKKNDEVKEIIQTDKKVYAVENSALTNGGTALDVLRQIPAVNVDGEGNISLRGSENVTIYINGKQSSLSGADRQTLLMQIPAANIESIEVNTNPGAKQDAEGISGFINITLKQNKTKGESGSASIGAGNNNKYNASFNYNINKGKWGSSNTLSLRQNDVWGRGYNVRTNNFKDSSFFLNQFQNSDNLNRNAALSGNLDFKPNKKWLFSLNYLASYNFDDNTEKSDIMFSDKNEIINKFQRIDNIETRNSFNYDAGLLIKKTFDKTAHNIVLTSNYSRTNKDNLIDIAQNYLDPKTEAIIQKNPNLLFNNSDNLFANTLLQLDYNYPIKDYTKLETGLKYTGRHFDADFMIDSFNHFYGRKEIDNSRTNRLVYDENVSAAYAMLTHTFKAIFKYNIGLRFENTSVDGRQITSNIPIRFQYNNLFPSGYFSVNLQEKYKLPDLQLGYSRRINRPNQSQLNPFVNVNDPYNLFRGNPNLKPELIDAIELSGFYNTKKVVYTTNLYFRQTNSVIWRYRVVDSLGISDVSFYNLDFNRSYGAEIIARFTIAKKIKTTLNANIFNQEITGMINGSNFGNKAIMFSGKINASYTFWNKSEIQASYNYMSARPTPQGELLPMFGLDLGFKKNIYKESIALGISLTDVFDNRRFKIEMEDYNFVSSIYRKRESRIVTVNLTWKFGNDSGIEKKPKAPERQPEMDF